MVNVRPACGNAVNAKPDVEASRVKHQFQLALLQASASCSSLLQTYSDSPGSATLHFSSLNAIAHGGAAFQGEQT
eukprot:6175682-Pleurochrysis_carterae.AAC.1